MSRKRARPAARRGVHRPYERVGPAPPNGEQMFGQVDIGGLLESFDDDDPMAETIRLYLALGREERQVMAVKSLGYLVSIGHALHPQLEAIHDYIAAHEPENVDRESQAGKQVFGLMDWSRQADVSDIIVLNQALHMLVIFAAGLDLELPEDFTGAKADIREHWERRDDG